MVLQKFFPKLITKVYSPINGEISVVEQWGTRKIVVSNLTQSGPLAEKVWSIGLQHVNMLTCYDPGIRNILILGLGGGSLAKLINKYFPKAKTIGVEIDPIMIDLGKKYLDLDKVKNLKIIINDATAYLPSAVRHKLKFDIIFVDLYIGDKVPKNCQIGIFLKNLKKILNENGMIIFNRLYFKNHIFEAKNFLDKLKKIFNDVICRKVLTNLLVFVRKNLQRR